MNLNSELARPGYFLLYDSFNLTVQCRFSFDSCLSYKLDGVGPVDNRPSTNKLHHFVRFKKKLFKEKNYM